MIRAKRSHQSNQEYGHLVSENDYTALRFLAKEVLRCIMVNKDIKVIKDKIYILLNVVKNFR